MSEKHKTNAYATYLLLKKYETNPSSAPPLVVSACKSQGALANLDLQNDGIIPVSLNNLKMWSDAVVEDGGWERLEEIRLNILKASKRSERKGSAVKKTTDDHLNELKDCLNKSERERLNIERAYFELLELLRNQANGNSTLRAQLDRHTAIFSMKRYLSLVNGGGEGR